MFMQFTGCQKMQLTDICDQTNLLPVIDHDYEASAGIAFLCPF